MNSGQTLMLQASVDGEKGRDVLLGKIRVLYKQVGLLGKEGINTSEPLMTPKEILDIILKTKEESIHLVTQDGTSATFERRTSIPLLRLFRHPIIATRSKLGK